MPYKHIAAHLKKTELACRLHYHQLSHGSNRRKRTTSVSSGSSTGGHSPIMPASIPSPIHEDSRSPTPPRSAAGYPQSSIQLPSIMSGNTNASPRLPAILPKPTSMTLITAGAGRPYGAHEPMPHSAPLLPAPNFVPTPTSAVPPHSATTAPSLRLDCSVHQPISSGNHPVDMGRLQAVYAAHRASFWSAIAAEYGPGANPAVLEQAWRSSGNCCAAPPTHQQAATPITPGTTPEDRDSAFYSGGQRDKTRISSILGIDANPRSPKEREMVRRLEEEGRAVAVVA
jgi:hypothetical protein